ncbi:MAG: glycosyltransferase family 4 protein [Clostridium sp.]|uniref:glycosyltransferase family 4 protein n=1 Tax=Clostridium TaxID=1485 RepID=UPI00290447E1|nr:glycosyltransferase family 4 protein [Clostridium sp.]MDU1978902.1 glycosyltransferase family 4 protein [Clostridium sp.]MDU1994332.1 glycosyltransferase family 4 protein [Clostridium sp.]MDU4143091.1 glycosyltransferase family 4 protein [Clostridium sp.]MDU6048911.1 glycosyltransferase family 4 protein [Clostridium sp.]MDU6223028.1 glycosyltransferase family 4 protein [Clostridium sp.]
MKKILVVCTTDSMIWNFLIPHIKYLENKGFYVECACSRTGNFFEKLISEYSIKMNLIPFERSPYKKENIRAYKMIVNLINEKGFDTIFCHEPVGGAMGRLAGHHCGCSVIYMAHGFHFFKGAPKINWLIYFNIEKYLSRFTDILITINEEDFKVASKFKAKKVCKVAGIGVDTTKFSPKEEGYLRKKYGIDDEAIILLSVGELIPRKNHETVIKALKMAGNSEFHYLIAGTGELEAYLKDLVKRLSLENQVHFLGYRNDISALCNASDIFIMPSVHEGLSVALMEAMGCGKAVIASEIRGNVDLIDNGKGGYLVPTYNVEKYMEAIETLSRSKIMRKQFGLYNIRKVKKFDVSFVKKQVGDILCNYIV